MNHDVAIVGGGMVGATLACALGEAGLRVALVEAREAMVDADDDVDVRVSALSPGSVRLLERLGAWPLPTPERVGVFRQMRVWDRRGFGEIHFDAADEGDAQLGHVVENSRLQAALEQRLARHATVRWYRPASLRGLTLGEDAAVLRLDGSRLRARLVVGADGSRSQVRELAGIEAEEVDYLQQAVVATVEVAAGHAETAWQRFLPGGPLAFLPLPGNLCSIVWSTTPEHAAALVAATDEEFAAALEEGIEGRLGTVTARGPRVALALRSLHAARYVDARVALVGDAAHVVHPLAGQGVNLGLLDAAALAEVVTDACRAGRDPGRRSLLRRYERWRRGHNALMRAALGGFNQVFASDADGVRLARNTALALAERMVPLKRLFMRQASGGGAQLPRLLRP